MDEFVAFSHSFWRFVLCIGPPEHSGSQAFHESSVHCSIIQSGSTLETANDRLRGIEERMQRKKPLVYCKLQVVEILVYLLVGEKSAGERSGSNARIEKKKKFPLSDLPIAFVVLPLICPHS